MYRILSMLFLFVQIWTPLGDPLQVTEASQHSGVQLALDPDGLPVVMWMELQPTFVRRWDGNEWVEVGSRLENVWTRSMAVNEQGEVAAVWTELVQERRDQNLPNPLTVSVADGETWVTLGDALNVYPAPEGRSLSGSITDAKLIAVEMGWVIAWREYDLNNVPHVFAAFWDGKTWQRLGESVSGETGEGDAEDHFAAREGDIFTHNWLSLDVIDGDPLVAWTEVEEVAEVQSAREIRVARWNGEIWEALPVLDGDFDLFDMAVYEDEITLAVQNSDREVTALYQLQDGEWVELPFPESEGYISSVKLDYSAEGNLVMLWLPNGLRAAQWDGQDWTLLTDEPLTNKVEYMINGDDIEIAAAPDGSLYAMWIDTDMEGARTRVSRLQPT